MNEMIKNMNEKLDELYSIFKALLLKNDNVNVQFLTYLDYNKFKYQPASTKYHYACEGGLLVHSLNVYVELKRLCKMYNVDAPSSVVGLLHDLCKIDAYIWSNGENKYLHNYNSLPLGHSEKSISLIQRFFPLTDMELMCIRWHMGAFEAGGDDKYFNAALEHPLVLLTHLADWISARIIEVDFEKNIDKLLEELRE
jgi:hypothetical protein